MGDTGGGSVEDSYAEFVLAQQNSGSEIAAVLSQDAALASGLNQLQESASQTTTPSLAEAQGEDDGESETESQSSLTPPEVNAPDNLQPSVISQQPSQTIDTAPPVTGSEPESTEPSSTDPASASESADSSSSDSVASPDEGNDTVSDTNTNTSQPLSNLPATTTGINDTLSETGATPPLTTRFESHEFPGFTGEITDQGVELSWVPTAGAKGYNLYRNSEFLTTVFESAYLDTDTPTTASNYYEAIAFDFNDSFSVGADGLTVRFKEEPAPELPDHIAANYTLVFAEEFENGVLDPAVWNTSYLWGTDIIINQEEQYYVDVMNEPDFGYNPFVLDDDTLTIRSIKTPDELKDKALGQSYLSGVITTYDSFKFTYGYVEARVKLPRGRGFWSAFWLLNAYYVDRKPEIDIMEHIGHDPDLVFHTYHYFDEEGNLRSTESSGSSGVDYTDDYHVFSVEWKPGTAIFYVDGVERHRISDSKMSNQEMYIIANTAIGGWWPGSPDESTRFPGEYSIDYIRAWQKTTPFTDVIFDDGIDSVPIAPDTQERSPNHLPPFEVWPEGYPER